MRRAVGGGGGGPPAGDAPVERLSRTLEPCATRVPPRGSCATTVPFGWVDGTRRRLGTSFAPRIAATAVARSWPTTFGTRTSPRETRITSVDPLATLAPAAGLCERTRPLRLREVTVTVCTSSPRRRKRPTAFAAFMPTTSGTTTWAAEETESVTVEPRVTCVPADGSSANTVPAGSLLALVEMRATRCLRFSSAAASVCF